MSALVEKNTDDVFTVKLALVAPAETVTAPGALAAPGLLLDSVTTAPPAGAGPVSVTVPVEFCPPATLAGFNVSEESVAAGAGATVSVAPRLTPP
jgi:hypothetical protein